MFNRSQLALAGLAILLAACDSYTNDPGNQPQLPPQQAITASGDIAAKVDEYRALIGTVRRINWDGVPDTLNNIDNKFPAEQFKTSQGVVYATAGTGFRNDSSLFAGVNQKYATQFNFFSAKKTFAPVASNIINVTFRVRADTTIVGVVTGFGAVFSDVDIAGSTTIEYFDINEVLIGRHVAPVRTDATGLSFVGVKFDTPIVARVKLTLGTGALGSGIDDVSDQGTKDLVIVDDFNFTDPVAP